MLCIIYSLSKIYIEIQKFTSNGESRVCISKSVFTLQLYSMIFYFLIPSNVKCSKHWEEWPQRKMGKLWRKTWGKSDPKSAEMNIEVGQDTRLSNVMYNIRKTATMITDNTYRRQIVTRKSNRTEWIKHACFTSKSVPNYNDRNSLPHHAVGSTAKSRRPFYY